MAKDRRAKRARSAPSNIPLGVFALAVASTGAACELGLGLVVLGCLSVVLGATVTTRPIDSRRRRQVQQRNYAAIQAEQAIANKEARLRGIFARTGDAYFEIDSEGHIVGWSDKAAGLFGFSATEATGSSLWDNLVAQSDVTTFSRQVAQCLSGEHFDSQPLRTTLVHRTGRLILTDITLWSTKSETGSRVSILVTDLSARSEFEQRMRQTEEIEREVLLRMRELDQSKSDFISSISHELRSPLTSTLGYLELLADGDAGELQPEQAHMVEVSLRNARRLQSMIEDVLSMSRIESGSFRVKFQPVDMRDLVTKAAERSAVSATIRNVRLSSKVSNDLGHCPGDEEQLARALDGVIGNAIKFTPPEGFVHLSVERMNKEVRIVIADNGVGIAGPEQSQVFNRFFRAASTIEQAHSGTGLGLTISKTIIEHHGGSIGIDSVVGKGTTVTITLPTISMESETVVDTIDAALREVQS